MGIFGRAKISMWRNKKQSITFFAVSFLLSLFLGGSILVREAAVQTAANMPRQMVPFVSLHWDEEAKWEEMEQSGETIYFERLDNSILQQLIGLPEVKAYNFSELGILFSYDLQTAPVSFDGLMNHYTAESLQLRAEQFQNRHGFNLFSEIRGSQGVELFDEQIGILVITDGRAFSKEELNSGAKVAIISEDLARHNNLSIGSQFIMENKVFDYQRLRSENPRDWRRMWFDEAFQVGEATYHFIVIGLFTPLRSFDYGEADFEFFLIEEQERLINRIYMPNQTVKNINQFQADLLSYYVEGWQAFPLVNHWFNDYMESTTIFEDERRADTQLIIQLYDSSQIRNFQSHATEILPDFWVVEDFSSDFEVIYQSIHTLQWLFNRTFIVSLMAVVIIFTLMILFIVQGKKYEIGIYRSLGEHKWKMFFQIYMEIFLLSFFAVAFSLVTSVFLADAISKFLLRRKIANAPLVVGFEMALPWELHELRGSTALSNYELLETFSLSVDMSTVALLFSLWMVVLFVASLVPYFYSMKTSTRKLFL